MGQKEKATINYNWQMGLITEQQTWKKIKIRGFWVLKKEEEKKWKTRESKRVHKLNLDCIKQK